MSGSRIARVSALGTGPGHAGAAGSFRQLVCGEATLTDLAASDAAPPASDEDHEFTFTSGDFMRVSRLLHAYAGISLGSSKRSMVYNRLARRVRARGLTAFGPYLDVVERDAAEHEACMNALTTNLTSFFREAHHFDALAQYVRSRNYPRLRVWCAAASTGEEPYSIAMTLIETYENDAPPVEIVASDIDTDVLAHAQRGVYALERLANVSDRRRARFFQRGAGPNAGYARVRPMLRGLIDFRQINLQSEAWPVRAPVDVVMCRNVLIYFEVPLQQRIVRRFAAVLSPQGLLITGHSENIAAAADIFVPLGQTVYRPRAGGAGAGVSRR
jgi:chemotaxis protein methyltransferase CheR